MPKVLCKACAQSVRLLVKAPAFEHNLCTARQATTTKGVHNHPALPARSHSFAACFSTPHFGIFSLASQWFSTICTGPTTRSIILRNYYFSN